MAHEERDDEAAFMAASGVVNTALALSLLELVQLIQEEPRRTLTDPASALLFFSSRVAGQLQPHYQAVGEPNGPEGMLPWYLAQLRLLGTWMEDLAQQLAPGVLRDG